MSTSAIVPVSSIDFASASATSSQQTVFNNLLSQLQQSIGQGNLTDTQTYLNALNALSPSSAGSQSALGSFLTSVGTALNDGSVTEAQNALTTYQSAPPATNSASSASVAADTTPTANTIAEGLILSQIQLSLITTLLAPGGSSLDSSNASSNSISSVTSILNEAYPASSTSTPANSSPASPYDSLVQAIQSSLAAGTGTTDPALAYLNSSGNFVDTSA